MISYVAAPLVAKGVSPADAELIVAFNKARTWPKMAEIVAELVEKAAEAASVPVLRKQIDELESRLAETQEQLSDTTYDWGQALKGA
jgi:predicted GTPase